MASNVVAKRCPACSHPELFRLANFQESDVNDKPTTDAIVPESPWGLIAPIATLAIIAFSSLADLLFGSFKVAKGRQKVRRARAEVLPRAPESLICPRCFEVLERF